MKRNNRSRIIMGFVAVVMAHSLQAADLNYIEVFKQQKFIQNDDAGPQTIPGNYVHCSATAGTYSPNPFFPPVSECSVQFPSGLVKKMVTKNSGQYFSLEASAATVGEIEAFFVPGNYIFQYVGKNDGSKSVIVPLPSPQYPPAPTVINYNAAQRIDANGNFTLSWKPWTDGTQDDVISLDIQDANGYIFFSSDSAVGGQLDGTATSIVIPAGKLADSMAYTASIDFLKIAASESFASQFDFYEVDFVAHTEFVLQTKAPAPYLRIVSQPMDQVVTNQGTGVFSIVAEGTATITYQWEFNGQPLAGETSARLSLTNPAPSQAGSAGHHARNNPPGFPSSVRCELEGIGYNSAITLKIFDYNQLYIDFRVKLPVFFYHG